MPYDKGSYVCEFTAQGFDESKRGKPYFWLAFTPQGRINPDDKDGPLLPCDEYEREVRLWLTEKAAKYSIANLRKLGWVGTDFSELENHISFVGKSVLIQCTHRHHGDKTYDEWALPMGGSAGSENKPGLAGRLTDVFEKQLIDSAENVEVRNLQAEAEIPANQQDEIPF